MWRNPPNVLLADSDSAVLDVFGKFFSGAGWRFEVVKESSAALTAATSANFDVIIADVDLPGTGCVEFLRTLREKKPAQAVIVMTGAVSALDALQLLKEGARDFLQKPVDFYTLQRSVADVLSGLKEKEIHQLLLRALKTETASYEFTTAEISGNRIPLLMADRLFAAGIIDQTQKLRMELAFQEAFTNSLEHGNLELLSEWKEEVTASGIDKYSLTKRQRLADPNYGNRKIRIATEYNIAGVLKVVITDEGKGFDFSKGGCKKAAEGELPCFGRGRALITGSVDEMSYAKGGREICMVMQLNSRTQGDKK